MLTKVLSTWWVYSLSLLITANTCVQAIWMGVTKKINRQWTDKAVSLWAKRLLWAAKVNYRVFNPNNTQRSTSQPCIIMCNHSSIYDIPLAIAAMPDSIRMLAKKELSKIPMLGQAMTAAEFPFINRHDRKKALEDLSQVKQLMSSGITIWIAPEGTRSKDGKLGKFKKGGFITAIQTGATIIPMGICGANKIQSKQHWGINTKQTVEIHIGQAIDATQYQMDNKEALVEVTEKQIRHLIGG